MKERKYEDFNKINYVIYNLCHYSFIYKRNRRGRHNIIQILNLDIRYICNRPRALKS